ncbi:hypothetical protein RHSIM_Rhsim09G0099200 [Rhododendron simsii]|uniref:Aminotransferase-like plant mobile domain-containing protein n=1 Tax=Rhododendron simsii TaxID=118357 RepID=A0A834GD38_RHOSS|nr:hypothetical protein RHSIM_Rhsim09G0099200 [Rhododendron simsii]
MDLNLNELRSPDSGPRDGSILHLQQHHRSRKVWEADVSDIWIIVRSAKKGIRALPWPSPPVLELIRRARLEGLYSLPFVSMDLGLITALLEQWRPETHTFHLRPGESTITLQDVEVLLGIPVEGKVVTGNTNLKPCDLCKRLLGKQPTEDLDINGMKVKASWLNDRFTGQVEEGADPEVVARQVRGYLLLLMGETIFVDHSSMLQSFVENISNVQRRAFIFASIYDLKGGYVYLANLERLENFDEAGMYSWGSGALANLYHNLCHGCKAGTKQITGCFILLQVWAWERWEDVFHSPDLATHLVGPYRYHLDIQRQDEVIWTSYSEELLESLLEYCWAGRAVWRANVPLIYYATCQYHQPERVMRQFGFHQCIPPPSRSLDPSHGKTLQSGALDWAFKYRTIIEVWNNRLNLVVPPGDIDLVDYPFDDPYVARYDRITRRCISHVGFGVDGVTRCLKALNMPGVPTPYRDVALAGLMHMGVFKMFLRFQPPQHVVEPTGGGSSSSQTCSHSEVPWEQLEVVGFGGSTFSHDSLVQARRMRIDESSLGDARGSVGDGDITQDDEVEEEANFQDSIVGGDREGGGEFSFLFDSLASASIVELDQLKNDNTIGQNLMVLSVEIEYGSCPREGESPSKIEFEAMIIRTAEMEKLKKMETKKVELELALTECQDQLKAVRIEPFEVVLPKKSHFKRRYPDWAPSVQFDPNLASHQSARAMTSMIWDAAVDVVDDSSSGIMFDISDKITGYTPVLFTETMDAIGSQANESVVHHRSSHRSQRQSRPNISQQRRNNNIFIENEENFEDVDEEPIIHEEVHDDITDIGAFEMHIRDIDEASQSSEEDVDALLEANESEQDPIRMFEKPSTMMTQDTWTNLVDHSPPMPTSSHAGWDGRSELLEGQIAMRYIVRDIIQATGRQWYLDDDFEYPLNPNMQYTPIVFREMQREYQCRFEQYEVLKFDCRTFNIPIPRCRAVDMSIDTHQLLQRALHHFREEVNRMQMRLQRHQYRFLANERRDEGLMGEARFYREASMNEDVQSDIEMSDEDQEP